jgi:rubrerythrin
MTERPSYLPMLEAIANAERQGYEYYQAWYEHATDPDLKETMRVVANRELEHSVAFRKRIDELGFECQPAEVIDFSKQIEIVTSDCSDWEKIQALELTDLADKVADPKNDPFGKLFRDLTIDVQTGALLGRYIAEERDSGRMLAACASAMVAKYGADEEPAADDTDRLAAVEEKLDAICAAVTQLQASIDGKNAKSAPNGKGKSKATAAA